MKSPLQNNSDNETKEIRRQKMLLFEQSVGYEFSLQGQPALKDIVAGVDWTYEHVCGQKYGNFHVDLCQLTGKVIPDPES